MITNEELQAAMDEFNDLLYKDANFCAPISLKSVQLIRKSLNFTMQANHTSIAVNRAGIDSYNRNGEFAILAHFKAMTAKIWEEIE